AQRHLGWLAIWIGLCTLPLLLLLPRLDLAVLPGVSSRPQPVNTAPLIEAPSITTVSLSPADSESGAPPIPPATHPSSWSFHAGAIWAIVFILLLIHQGLGYARLHAITRKARPVESGDWERLFHEVSRPFKLRRPVRLRQTDALAVPAVWGGRKPTLLLPADHPSWDQEQKRMVLLHEMAHLARSDWQAQTFARAVALLYWFNPLAWWALARTRLEAEQACDDRVLENYPSASGYADLLVRVAQDLPSRARIPRCALTMARPNDLARRVRGLLDEQRNRNRGSGRTGLVTGFIGLLLFLTVSLVRLTAAPEPTPSAIQPSLTWLMKHQAESGAWEDGSTTIASTAFPLAALQQQPRGKEVKRALDKGVGYLIEHQKENGYFAGRSMYEHGFATQTLADLYGDRRTDKALEAALKKAVELILDTQKKNTFKGWRYRPDGRDADLSITACQLAALATAARHGIDVPESALEDGVRYILKLQNEDGGFNYTAHGQKSGAARTLAALTALVDTIGLEHNAVRKGLA
ncbi:MAG: M56 family metallopeptidase, partial [Verrucomicrobiota bacterium]